MTLCAVASLEPKHLDRHHGAAAQRHQTMRRAHEVHTAPAGQLAIGLQLVAHDLGDGQLGNGFFQRLLQARVKRGASDQAVIKQGLDLAVRCSSERSQGRNRVRHIGTQRLQFLDECRRGLAGGVKPHGDGHEFHQLLRVRCL